MAEKSGRSKPDASETTAIQVPIEWHIGPEVITRYVNQATIQGTPSDFHISFFEVRPPIVLGSTEEETKTMALPF